MMSSEYAREYMRDYRKGIRRRRSRKPNWAYLIRNRYGIEMDRYEDMLKEQDGLCAVCRSRSNERLSVDHDHDTGKVRALLCRNCNLMIGNAKENPEILIRASTYLREHGKGLFDNIEF